MSQIRTSTTPNEEPRSHLVLKTSKVFCIGHNKTGTTSLEAVLREFGYKMGDQSVAELLLDHWAARDFKRIIDYCHTAEAFQDIPFSLDFTYQAVDQAFPNSKFILTIRKNADEWYQSLVRFHAKLMGVTAPPDANTVKNYFYCEAGWLWRAQQYIFGIDETTIYDETIYKAQYNNHNRQVVEYFRFRPNDLLVLNLKSPDAMENLCQFLGVKYTGQLMPHLNVSA
jgi:Sulfotransferase domain